MFGGNAAGEEGALLPNSPPTPEPSLGPPSPPTPQKTGPPAGGRALGGAREERGWEGGVRTDSTEHPRAPRLDLRDLPPQISF